MDMLVLGSSIERGHVLRRLEAWTRGSEEAPFDWLSRPAGETAQCVAKVWVPMP